MAKMTIGEHFDYEWKNPPKPFNPQYDPKAKDRYSQVTASLEECNYYQTHTREECAKEWARRYAALRRT